MCTTPSVCRTPAAPARRENEEDRPAPGRWYLPRPGEDACSIAHRAYRCADYGVALCAFNPEAFDRDGSVWSGVPVYVPTVGEARRELEACPEGRAEQDATGPARTPASARTAAGEATGGMRGLALPTESTLRQWEVAMRTDLDQRFAIDWRDRLLRTSRFFMRTHLEGEIEGTITMVHTIREHANERVPGLGDVTYQQWYDQAPGDTWFRKIEHLRRENNAMIRRHHPGGG